MMQRHPGLVHAKCSGPTCKANIGGGHGMTRLHFSIFGCCVRLV
jgi:hypothetical protein